MEGPQPQGFKAFASVFIGDKLSAGKQKLFVARKPSRNTEMQFKQKKIIPIHHNQTPDFKNLKSSEQESLQIQPFNQLKDSPSI